MNEPQYLEFCSWLDIPQDKIVPYGQLTSEQIQATAGSLAYARFGLKKAQGEFSKVMHQSFAGLFPFLRS